MKTILEQDDSLDMKEVAVYPRFMIRNAGGDYWSNENGWTDYSDADVFNHVEQQSLRLPQGGEWVSLAESAPTVGNIASDLKALLGEDFVNKTGDYIHDQGLLYELEWNPKGRLSESLSFVGPVLTVRVNLNETDSKRLHLEQCQTITKDLAAGIKALLPEDAKAKVQVVPRKPKFDQWNERWNCELIVVESTEDELDVKDVYFPSVPPDFAMPEGLSEHGRAAWHAITSLLAQHDALHSGGHTHVFYSPEEWAAKREQYGEGSELIVVHDGGDHAPYFNGDYGAMQLLTMMTLALAKAGCYPQPMTGWGTAIHKKDEPDEEEIEALEKWLKDRERRPLSADQERLIRASREAAAEVEPVEPVEESEDDIDVKDLELPPDKEGLIRHLFNRAGLRIAYIIEAPHDPKWGQLGNPQRIIHSYLQPSNDKPWSTVNRSSPELATFCQQMKSYLYTVLDTDDIDWTTRWDMDVGAWEIVWHIGDPEITVERRVEDDKPVQEAVQDEDDFLADVTKPDRANTWDISAQWKAFVRGWWDNNWQVMDDRLHAVNREGYIDGYMTRNLKDDQAKAEITRLIYDKMNGGEIGELDWYYHPASGLVNVLIKRVGGEVTLEALDAPIRPCVHCGYCCKKAPCPYGEPDPEKGCKHLTADNKCGVYDKAKDDPVSPAFGTGCCSPMNTLRLERIRQRKKLGEADDDFDVKELVDYKITRRDVELEMANNGILSVLPHWEGDVIDFQGTWVQNQPQDKADELLMRVVNALGLTAYLDTGHISFDYEPTRGTIDLFIHHRTPALREAEDDFDAKEMFLPGAKLNVEDIKNGLLEIGAQRVSLWPYSSKARAFVCHWPNWTIPDMLAARHLLRRMGVSAKDMHWVRTSAAADNFMLIVPRRLLTPHRLESVEPGLVNRIIESGGIVRKVQETEQQDVLKITGEWNKGSDLDTLAEALAVDKDVTNYDPKTGTFNTLATQESLLQEQTTVVENSEQGDDKNRVAIVAVFRKAGEGYECLVCKREYPPAEGEWVIAGGHAEEGESIEAAAHREMKEETKLDLGDLTFIKIMPNETGKKEVTVYGTLLPDGEKAKAGDDAEKVKWVPLNDLPPLGLDNDKLIREIARKMKLLKVEESEDDDFDMKDVADSGDGWVVGPAGHSMAIAKHPETGFRLYLQYGRTVDNPLNPGTGHHVFSVELKHHLDVKDRQEIAALSMAAALERAKAWANDHPAFREVRDHWVEEGLEHLHQTCEYDCGPTCIKMVANALGTGSQHSIGDLTKIAGSDAQTGTDDKKMAVGLQAAGVPFKVGEAKDTDGLIEALDRGSYIILRTLTRGIKHWVVVYRFEGDKFLVNDPWLGRITYTPEELVGIWKPRDYFYFEVPRVSESKGQVVALKPVTDDVMQGLEEALTTVFAEQADWVVPYVVQHMNPRLSVVAIANKQVVGFYILGDRQIGQAIQDEGLEPTEDLSVYNGKSGIEGVALGIIPQARGTGLGSKLKDYPQRLGANYIWGLQLHALGNLEHWLKRRRVVARNEDMVATLQDYTGAVSESDDEDYKELYYDPDQIVQRIMAECPWCMDVAQDKAAFIDWIESNAGLFPDVNRAVQVIQANESWCCDNYEDMQMFMAALDLMYPPPMEEGLEDDIDAHELTTTPATEENLTQLFRQSGLQFEKVEDYGPHYRQFIGNWEPRRQPGQVVAYWTKIIEDAMGLNPHDFGFGYDPETGRMSVLVRKAVIQ